METKTQELTEVAKHDSLTVALVWIFRILVGGTFIMSGLTKMIDLYGSVYKIEQYLAVWDMMQPRTLVLGMAICLSGVEFLLGFLLLLGCYKRSASYLLTMIMAGMLVLSAYIMIADPVDDCGCFGDFLVISNTATFLKNIVLVAMLVYLCFRNSRVDGLFTTYSQWLVAFFAILYLCVIGYFGFNVQPLADFRPYPVGTYLIPPADDEETDIKFVYEKNGVKETFSVDNLPDSTWTFVDRIEEAPVADKRNFAVFDGDEEVTEDVISNEGNQLLLLIPELSTIDVSSTYLINEMNRYITSRGGDMIGIIGTGAEGIEQWRDISMASYDIYSADDTSIKEVARGNVAMVYLKDGIIQWKRTLTSIDSDLFVSPDDSVLDRLAYSGRSYLGLFTLVFLGLELALWIVDRSGRAVKLHFTRKNRKK